MRYRAALLAACLGLAAAGPPSVEFGRPATPDEIAGADIDVHPDGTGLPLGQGGVEQGAALYASKCAACHGVAMYGKRATVVTSSASEEIPVWTP